MDEPVYATREDVMRALDVKESARNRREIDSALAAASRSVDSLCHRTFYPVLATKYFDWPAPQYGTAWRVWLDDSELASLNSISSGGTTISTSDVLLEPNRTGPPYSRLELNIGSDASFGGGPTYQRDIQVDGVWAGCALVEAALGDTVGAIDDTQTTVTVDGATSAEVGVGSLLRLGSERLIVIGRTQASTGQTGTLGGGKSDVALTVADGTEYAVDEVLLLDAERIRIDDIAGNVLAVERAYDGTVLAAHTSAPIYAPRTLTVTRGALGTTTASHNSGTTVNRWVPPGLVHQLAKAEAITILTQERSGWFLKASTTGNSAAKVSADALQTLRDQTYTEHGRKARHRAV
ncbi:hypothetical protein [Streptomyces sp. NPDC127038]|uniref:hypothetical protein n=1 Tax=Streptomyces sp. NPDC127038 TaxID=3347114 RepID=UPI00365B6700